MINKKFSPSQSNFTAIWSQNSTFAMMTSQRSSSVVAVLVLCGMLCCSSVGVVQAQSEYVNIPLDGSNVTGHVVFMGEPWVGTFTPTTYGAVSHPPQHCHTPTAQAPHAIASKQTASVFTILVACVADFADYCASLHHW